MSGLETLAMVASLAATTASTVHTYKVSKNNKNAEEKAAKLRAEERGAELRRTLAAQRMAMIGQGRDPDTGTGLVLQDEAWKAAERDSVVDRWQTGIAKENWENQGTSAVLSGVGSGISTVSDWKWKRDQSNLGKGG